MSFGFANVAAITMICYLVGRIVKVSPLADKWIPALTGAAGGILGIVAMASMPSFPARDPVTAAAIGIASGLAATGVHQAAKQIKKE